MSDEHQDYIAEPELAGEELNLEIVSQTDTVLTERCGPFRTKGERSSGVFKAEEISVAESARITLQQNNEGDTSEER